MQKPMMVICMLPITILYCLHLPLPIENTMKVRRLFPLGKAYGIAFCNRIDETQRLITYIESGIHTYLVAPRRYGKSSLCERVLQNTTLPLVTLDFHLAVTEKNCEQIILNGV